MIRLLMCGDFGVSQKLFDITPRHRQLEHAFSVDFFGGLKLLRTLLGAAFQIFDLLLHQSNGLFLFGNVEPHFVLGLRTTA